MLKRIFRTGRSTPRPYEAMSLKQLMKNSSGAVENDRLQRQKDFQVVFSDTPQGRRVLTRILERCRVCERSFVPGDALEIARREGMRDIGIWLLDLLHEDTERLPSQAEDRRPAFSDISS